MPLFIWDENNSKHLFLDHPERELSIDEIESMFNDPMKILKDAGLDDRGREQFICIAESNKNLIRFVMYNIIGGSLRIFYGRTAKKNKERKEYLSQFE